MENEGHSVMALSRTFSGEVGCILIGCNKWQLLLTCLLAGLLACLQQSSTTIVTLEK